MFLRSRYSPPGYILHEKTAETRGAMGKLDKAPSASLYGQDQVVVDGPTEKEVSTLTTRCVACVQTSCIPQATRCATLVEPLNDQLRCPICVNVLKDPQQTPCGHRFCRNCLATILRTANAKCPVDGQDLDPATIFPDVSCQRELLNLVCVCPFTNEGCTWKGELRDFQKHCDECMYSDVQCLECGEHVQKGSIEEHKLQWCNYRPVKCKSCEDDIPQVRTQEHLEICPKVKEQCVVGCGMDVPRDVMETHVTEECPKAEKLCAFRIHGCEFKGTKDELAEHCKEASSQHLDLMNYFAWQCKTQSQRAEENIAFLESRNNQLTQQLAVQNETLAVIRQDVRTQQRKLDVFDKSWAEHKKVIAEFRQKEQSSANALPDEEVILPQIEEMLNALKVHERKLVGMEQEMGQLQTTSHRNGVGEFGPRSLAGFSRGEERRLERTEHQLTMHEIRLSEADICMQVLQATSYDGNFIWKIDNYSQRFQDAASGKTPSIYSAPFYVGRFGYKVCARLYPYGDGMGKGSHLSLFFVVMRGECDALLPWAFNQKVNFRLIDQDRIEDVTDAFRPDSHSASFQRPTSNMNIASGCPLFISHSALRSRGYVKDNVMFIKVSVDMNGLPSF